MLGKRMRVGDSFSSSVWYSQRLVGTVEQQGTGELCCAGCKGRRESTKSRASISIQSHSKRGQWKLGAGRKDIWAAGVDPTDRLLFQAEKLKSCIAGGYAFPPLLVIPLSAVMCTFENYISLESCNSDMSGTHVLMCQGEPSTLAHNDWSDFNTAFGKCRLEKITERTTSQALIETTFFSACEERLLPFLLSVSLAPPLLPQHTLCQYLTLLADLDVNVMTCFCLLAGSKECHAWRHVFQRHLIIVSVPRFWAE